MITRTTTTTHFITLLSSKSQCRYYKLPKYYPVRFMHHLRAVARKAMHKTFESVDKKHYVSDRIHTPKPTTSSNEGLNNNPAIPFIRKNKPSTVVQHPEWVKDFCDKPGCAGKLCVGICGEKIFSKSIAHFTHSDNDKHSPQKVSDTDLDYNEKPLYAKLYAKPHETSGESYDSEADKKKTEALKKKLQDIKDQSKNDDHKNE